MANPPNRVKNARPMGRSDDADWITLPVAWASDLPSVTKIMYGRVTSVPPRGRGALTRTAEVATRPGGTSSTAGAKAKRTIFSGSSPRSETRIGWAPFRLSTTAATRPSLRFDRRSTLGSRRTRATRSQRAKRPAPATPSPQRSSGRHSLSPDLTGPLLSRRGRQESRRRPTTCTCPAATSTTGCGKVKRTARSGSPPPR